MERSKLRKGDSVNIYEGGNALKLLLMENECKQQSIVPHIDETGSGGVRVFGGVAARRCGAGVVVTRRTRKRHHAVCGLRSIAPSLNKALHPLPHQVFLTSNATAAPMSSNTLNNHILSAQFP